MYYFTKDKPYNSLNQYNKEKYGAKIAKIPLSGGFTCPNRDGKKGTGGCTFCSNFGSGEFAGDIKKSIKEQFLEIKEVMERKWPNILYMPYFQAYSNTYGDLDTLNRLYNEALNVIPEKTIGLSVATRGDCIDEDIAALLGKLNEKTHIQVELGLQTSNEEISNHINRCMNNSEFEEAISLLRKYNIEIVVHIINGLPNETLESNLETIRYLNKLDIQGIKFHSLLLLKNTKLEEEYNLKPFKILTKEEYVKIVAKQITILRPDIIIHRLAADGVVDDLIAPLWTIKKMTVMNDVDKYLRNNNLYQGIYYKKES